MFDLQAQDGSVRRRPYSSPIPAQPGRSPAGGGKTSFLNSPQVASLHARLMDYYLLELAKQSDNRREMAEDEDFYDNEQWSAADKEILEERGQKPLVYNVLAATIDWITGTQKRMRTDARVLPRRATEAKPAQRKTQLLKYVSDANSTPFQISRSFEEAVKAGLSFIECGYERDADDEPLYDRHESWRNVIFDSSAGEASLDDARYMFRTKWLDVDILIAMFPNRASLIAESAETNIAFGSADEFADGPMDSREYDTGGTLSSMTSYYANTVYGAWRRRVRTIEAWFRVPVPTSKLSGGPFSGEIYDPYSGGHRASVEEGEAEVTERLTMRMHVALMTHKGMLWLSRSPYRHNRFPLTPVWGFRRAKDGLPYGLIRRLKLIQEDINKRASKALHILSTNKVIMDDDALPDDMTIEDLQDEMARPDAIIRVRNGSRFEINADRDLSEHHIALMSRSIAMIQQASGVTDENLGRRTNATSGVAIQRRQEQGSLASVRFFDNLHYAQQKAGEKRLSLIEQFMTEHKQFRITNSRGAPEYVDVNDGLPENDITRTKADYIMDESDFNATMRQAAAAQLLETIKLFPPQISMILLDLIVEEMDIPNAEEIVKRIRSVTGQMDPDEDPNTPEAAARVAAQMRQSQMQQALAQAQLRKAIADALLTEKRAGQAEAGRISTIVDAVQKSLTAAQTAYAAPHAVDASDHILHEAGFMSRDQIEAAVKSALAANQQPPQPQQQAPAAAGDETQGAPQPGVPAPSPDMQAPAGAA